MNSFLDITLRSLAVYLFILEVDGNISVVSTDQNNQTNFSDIKGNSLEKAINFNKTNVKTSNTSNKIKPFQTY